MTPERYAQVSAIFQEALERPTAQREAFVRERCGEDPTLAGEVRLLLNHAHSSADAFADDKLGSALEDFSAVSGAEPLPERIASYRVIRLIGEGGMGRVYEAEQENPRRRVAVKVVRAELESAAIARRFEQEAQILGAMQHPSIAQVYEAGKFRGEGRTRSFFAMEYIDGMPLLAYAEQNHLSSRQKLALLATVADGIEHAHRHNVIHRDLKPGNILVDAGGAPKILDFGVARLVDAGPDVTQHTQTGQIVGTVAYMSPEQLAGDQTRVDARTDVFALGVIGYELLTGRLPVDVRNVPLAEAARRITENDPEPLSVIRRELRGDVDAIIRKCLEKDPGRRYASAADVAADIRAFLADQPVKAQPPSTAYQLRKFSRRNPGLVGGVAIAFLALAVGTTVAIAQALKATRSAQIARTELARATEVKGVISNLLTSIRPEEAAGLDTTLMKKILAKTAKRLDTESVTDPLIEAELRYLLGKTYRIIAEYALADAMQTRALELRRTGLGPDHPDTLASMAEESQLLLEWGKVKESQPLLQETFERSLRVYGPDNIHTIEASDNLASAVWLNGDMKAAEPRLLANLEKRRQLFGPDSTDTLMSVFNLGALRATQGRYEEALEYFQKALEGLRRAVGDEHPFTLRALRSLGEAYRFSDRLPEAEAACLQAVETSKRVFGEGHPDTLSAENFLGLVYESERKTADAEAMYKRVLAGRRQVLGDDHADTLVSMNNLANLYSDRGNYQDAEPLYRECLERRRRVLGDDHEDTIWAISNLGQALLRSGRLAEALPLSQEALERRRKLYGDVDPLTLDSFTRVGSLDNQLGRAKDAAELLRGAEPAARQLWPAAKPSRGLGGFLSEYGLALTDTGDFPGAEKVLLDAHALLLAAAGPNNGRTRTCQERLVHLYSAWHASDPAGGHQAAADKWQQTLDEAKAGDRK